MSTSTEIESFFENLSERLSKENVLSDITWALCESIPDFKRAFLTFFFENLREHEGEFSRLLREYYQGNSRVDFYIKHKDINHIIEVKIWDRNDHFKEYKETFSDHEFGWIANYTVDKQEGIKIRTWKEFKKHVTAYFKDRPNILVTAYLKYLDNVCPTIEIKKMNLNNLESLYHFNATVKEIIEEGLDNYKMNVYYDWMEKFWDDRSGYYSIIYSSKPYAAEHDWIAPWFGVFYSNKPPKIYMAIENNGSDHNKGIFVKVNEKMGNSDIDSEWCGEFEKYSGVVWIPLSDKYFKEFSDDKTAVERQKEILKTFFRKVVQGIFPI